MSVPAAADGFFVSGKETVFCVGHLAPCFEVADAHVVFVTDADLDVPNTWYYEREYADLEGSGRALSEYPAMFALRRRLAAAPDCPPRLVFTQYRKFISRRSMGSPVPGMPYARAALPAEVRISHADLLPQGGHFLVSTPFAPAGGMLGQYAHHHVLRDLLAFAVDAVDVGAIAADEAQAFITHPWLLPGGALGCYDAQVFMDIFERLERVALHFMARHFVPRDGYQRRAAAFCLERLNSYLLLKALGFPKVRQESVGLQVVLTPDGRVRPTL